MNNPKTFYNPDTNELFETAVKIISESLISLLVQKDVAIFAVCGGRSVAPIFSLLSKIDEVEWSKVHIFMVDERLVPIDSDLSNFKSFKINFLNNRIRKESPMVHPFIYDPDDQSEGADRYAQQLKSVGGSYDLGLFSSGEDGHIGALYPNHHSIDNNSEYYITMDDSPKPPSERMSMSRKMVENTREAVLLVIGETKRVAYNKILDLKTRPEDCPAKLLTNLRSSYLITDLK